MVRTHLLSGLLETFRLNRSQPTPQRIFELGDVCFIRREAKTGAADVRKIAAAIMDPGTGFAHIKSVVEGLAREVDIPLTLQSENYPPCIPGRCALIVVNGEPTGFLGEVHPQVLENFALVQPVTIFEMTL
jgi:phenylalanyl-tRNA synthetase beta chain